MNMRDPNPQEMAHVFAAGRMGGEYLDSIATTDLARLTTQQWQTFLLAIIGSWEHQRLDREIPF